MAFSGLQKTRQGLAAIARSLYGSFAGKAESVTIAGPPVGVLSFISSEVDGVISGISSSLSGVGSEIEENTGIISVIDDGLDGVRSSIPSSLTGVESKIP